MKNPAKELAKRANMPKLSLETLKQLVETTDITAAIDNVKNGKITSVGEARLAIELQHELPRIVLTRAVENNAREAFDYIRKNYNAEVNTEMYKAMGMGSNAILNFAVVVNSDMAEYLLKEVGLDPDGITLDLAVGYGTLNIVSYILYERSWKLGKQSKPDEYTILAATRSRTVVVREILDRCGLRPTKVHLDYAAQYGNTELVEYLCENYGIIPDDSTLELAAQSGNGGLTNYLLRCNCTQPSMHVLNYSAENGNEGLVEETQKWFGIDPAPDYSLLLAIARGCNLENFSRITDICLPSEEHGINLIARNGDKDRVMRKLKNPKNRGTLNIAAESGNKELVESLINEHGLQPDNRTLDRAAKSGNKELVEWLTSPTFRTQFHGNWAPLTPTSEGCYSEHQDSPTNNYGLEPDVQTLINAVSSGPCGTEDKKKLARYLVNNYDLGDDGMRIMENVVLSGDEELIEKVAIQYNIYPNMEMLVEVARRGGKRLLFHLVQKFNIPPTTKVWNELIHCRF